MSYFQDRRHLQLRWPYLKRSSISFLRFMGFELNNAFSGCPHIVSQDLSFHRARPRRSHELDPIIWRHPVLKRNKTAVFEKRSERVIFTLLYDGLTLSEFISNTVPQYRQHKDLTKRPLIYPTHQSTLGRIFVKRGHHSLFRPVPSTKLFTLRQQCFPS